MTFSPVIAAKEWADGHSRFVVAHHADGRMSVGVHDIRDPGYAASFAPDKQAEIAAFIEGAR